MSRQSETGPARLRVETAKDGTGKTTVPFDVARASTERGRDVLFVYDELPA